MGLTPYWDGDADGSDWSAAGAFETRRRAVRWGEACEGGGSWLPSLVLYLADPKPPRRLSILTRPKPSSS